MTRLPQLEQELLAAATRLQSPRRRLAPVARAALAVGTVLVLVLIGVIVAARDGGGERRQPPGALPFAPNATLEDMLGVFRRPATAADDMGFSKDDFAGFADRQPGEDPTRSRRVEWPGATIFLWPMRDGVCYGVRGGEAACRSTIYGAGASRSGSKAVAGGGRSRASCSTASERSY